MSSKTPISSLIQKKKNTRKISAYFENINEEE